MIVIVSGPRDWEDREQVPLHLDRLLVRHVRRWCEEIPSGKPDLAAAHAAFVLRHGVSGNVDTWANEWGIERGVTIERFQAEWHPNGGPLDLSAGPRRNREMAKAEPLADLWLAFWDGKFKKRGSGRQVSGTFDGITAALEAGIDVWIKPPRRP